MRRRVLHIGADHAGLGPQLLVALVDLPELVGLGIAGLEEIGVELANERNVGRVEPDDAVVAVVDMAVPAHRRRQDQVAVMHVAAAAVDDGGGALGARREADRREGVPVRPRAVAGIEHGEGRDQVGGRHRLAAERRVHQDQRAPLDIVDRHLGDRPLGERLDVLPAPEQRRVLGLGLDRRQRAKAIPQRMQVRRFELRDEVGALLRRGCRVGHGGALRSSAASRRCWSCR